MTGVLRAIARASAGDGYVGPRERAAADANANASFVAKWRATFDNSDAVEGQALWSDAEGPRVTIKFDGDYANYAEQYLGGVLSGSVELTVTEVSAYRTNITADTRFSLVYIAKDPATGSPTHVEYFWSSGQRCQMVMTDENGMQVTRTMQSTNYVEGQIQEVLDDLFRGEA